MDKMQGEGGGATERSVGNTREFLRPSPSCTYVSDPRPLLLAPCFPPLFTFPLSPVSNPLLFPLHLTPAIPPCLSLLPLSSGPCPCPCSSPLLLTLTPAPHPLSGRCSSRRKMFVVLQFFGKNNIL